MGPLSFWQLVHKTKCVCKFTCTVCVTFWKLSHVKLFFTASICNKKILYFSPTGWLLPADPIKLLFTKIGHAPSFWSSLTFDEVCNLREKLSKETSRDETKSKKKDKRMSERGRSEPTNCLATTFRPVSSLQIRASAGCAPLNASRYFCRAKILVRGKGSELRASGGRGGGRGGERRDVF